MLKEVDKIKKFHSRSVKEILKELHASKKGLPKHLIKKRLYEFGYNELPEKKKINFIFIFLKQFNSFLIYILLLAAAISFFAGNYIDIYVIFSVILINASIGFSQEYRAEKAIEELKKMVVVNAKVYRDGELIKIPARDLVPGDVIFLEEGDKIPADARIIFLKNFRTVESSLTGESFPAEKILEVLPEKISVADMKNMIFMGTFVASGTAEAVVVATGSRTIIGKIAKEIETIKRVESHFKQKTDILTKQMAFIAFCGALITFLVGFFIRGIEFTELFLFTIASLVSGIPEGLPAVLAIVLAIGAYRMSKKNAIVRNLHATETLGVVSTIITDKTGTLTENTMNIEKVVLPGQEDIKITGKGWEPIGEFFQENKKINPKNNLHLSKIIDISALCNNARVLKEDGKYQILGDPTEACLAVLAQKSNLEKNGEKIDDLPFSSELKYRACLVNNESKKQIYVVGAPEIILKYSNYFLEDNHKRILNNTQKKKFLKQIEILSKESMRVLAFAYKEVDSNIFNISDNLISKLNFVGFVGIRDPPRPEVKEAIIKAKNAGIRIIMVTGDHKETAIAIAKEIGLVDEKNAKAYTEIDLLEMSNFEFKKAVKEVNIFARLSPEMKLKISEELQKSGKIIAMTGDGVNDAPALKRADIGVSMGIMGTDVARESSEIILSDDNFASIVNAIEEGRIVFVNTRQAASFLVTTNFAENATIITSLFLGFPLPLIPTQILWLNLVTDGFTDVALASEPGHNDVLNEKPRDAKENILSKETIPFLILMSLTMIFITIFVFKHYLPFGIDKARTGAFVVMAFTQLFNSLNMRSLKSSLFKIGIFTNKFLAITLFISLILIFGVIYIPFFHGIFHFVNLGLTDFFVLFLISSSVFIFGEIYKFVKNRTSNN